MRGDVALLAGELRVATLVTCGLSNKEIAERLIVSPSTVRTHIHNACSKLQVRNRTQIALWVLQAGLLSLEEACAVGGVGVVVSAGPVRLEAIRLVMGPDVKRPAERVLAEITNMVDHGGECRCCHIEGGSDWAGASE